MISIIVFSVGILVGGAGMVLLSLGASELLQRFLATDWEAEPEAYQTHVVLTTTKDEK